MKNDRKISIREAKPDDNAQGASLVFSILRSYGIEPDVEGLDADIAQFGLHRQANRLTFVADDGDSIVGVATLNLDDREIALLSGLYVHPSQRRRGIARDLLNAVIQAATSADRKQIKLETRERFAEAIKLYESSGWKRGRDCPQGYGPERTYFLSL
jgi:GNAT superfamily N-acetyltransferase